jgi:diphthamide synthase (EF-2-diphthine--ammonia ligase)
MRLKRKVPAVIARDPSGRDLVKALADAHREGVELVRTLLIAQEIADAWMFQADNAGEQADSDPTDRRAERMAAEARTRWAQADADELRATEHWAQHVEDVRRLLVMAEELFPTDLSLTVSTACRTTVAARRRRSRGHCRR